MLSPTAIFSSSPLALSLQGGVDVGIGINDLGQGEDVLGAAEGVTGMGVAQFDHGADVAGSDLIDRFAVLPVQAENLSEALIGLARAVEEVHAGFDRARNRPGKTTFRPHGPRSGS